MSDSAPFRVVSGDEFAPAELVRVLTAAYGHPFTEDWLQWKHRDGPWGPSRCWVAADDDGILGLMFGLPWPYRVGRDAVPGARLVDGGSTPRARGRGVFRAVVAQELAQWGQASAPGVLVATATPEAAGAHVKNGATALDPVDYAYGPAPRLGRARLVVGPEVLDTYHSDERPTLHTDWSGPALRWRTDERAGYRYEAAALANASEANGVVYRVTSVKGFRVLVLLLTWGVAGDVRALLGAVALRTKTPVLLGPTGPGAAPRRWPSWIRRGTALLCVWPRVDEPAASLSCSRSGWGLSGLDVEGVI